MILKFYVKYCKILFIDKLFGIKYFWKVKFIVFFKVINYILILIFVLLFSIIIMIVEFLKFIVNNVLKSNNRLEKKKSKLFVRKKKKL